nr:heme lyase CcmF/NrfE family subunit [Pigmentibacter ruber]
MIEVGYFSFCLAFLFSIYGLLMGGYSLFKPNIAVISSARNALICVFFCVLFSSLILWNAIFFHDFSVKYVYKHSSIDMPPLYLFTSFWSALEGSHLLWTLLMSAIVTLSLVTVKKENNSYFPALCLAYGCSLFFMLFLNVTYSAPLERLFPAGKFGEGMNALLQNPYMAIHPPMLFTGYCLLIVPFAYSFAALIYGKFSPQWISTVRTWNLYSWAVLTIAIFLGGKWAYVELGWGGYWGWDPVENSSFMPWLALTAGLHTLLITDKTGRLPRLLLFLNMLAFALTFLGTFITRSGVISSVHSFAESEIGPAYLIWVVFLLTLTTGLVLLRGYLLPGAAKANDWRVSKESALLFTIFFFLFLLALVFIGTILPLVVEATRGIKISIQQPFFNAFAPWIGFGLVLLLGIGNLFRWKNGKIPNPIYCLLLPFILAGALTYFIKLEHALDFKNTIAFQIIIWTSLVLIMDLIYKLKALRWNTKLFIIYNRPYLGSIIIHLGFLCAIAGFIGNYRGVSAEVNLKLHESTEFNGYILKNEGLGYNREYNAQYVINKIKAVKQDSKEEVFILPMRSKFTNNEQWFNEIGIHSTIWHDLYIVLASFDINSQSVSLKINWNPTVKLVWTSLLIMILGAAIAVSHKIRKRSLEIDENGTIKDTNVDDYLALILSSNNSESSSKISSSMLIIFIISLFSFGLSGSVFAQSEPKLVPVLQLDPKLVDVAQELRCPTCIGMSVLESDTLQSVAMRTEIEKQLTEGKNKEQIIDYFKKAYGPWILREPDSKSSLGFLIWLIPVLGIILGPLFIIFCLKRARNKMHIENEKLLQEIKKFVKIKKEEIGKC